MMATVNSKIMDMQMKTDREINQKTIEVENFRKFVGNEMKIKDILIKRHQDYSKISILYYFK